MNQQPLSERRLHLTWWELNLPMCMASASERVTAYTALHSEGYRGLVLSHLSRFEMAKADRLAAECNAVVMNAELNSEFHFLLGNHSYISKEYFFKSEKQLRDFGRTMLERPRTRTIIRNDLPTVVTNPTVENALSVLNWKLFSGDVGCVLSIEDGPHLSEVNVMLALAGAM